MVASRAVLPACLLECYDIITVEVDDGGVSAEECAGVDD